MSPSTNAGPPAQRTFAVGFRGEAAVVYDPLTGQTHRLAREVPPGRAVLDPAEIATRPPVHPGELGGRVPVSVCWSPLVRCNLACPHCLDDKIVPELPRPDRDTIAQVLAASTVLGVDISGGEPLLLRDLGTLIDILVEGGCAVSVTTNGTHLARRAEALAPHVDAVRVSLDGPDAERHDRWRGRGSFAKTVAGIRAAVAHGIPSQIQTVLMRSTTSGVRAMVELAAALGVTGVTFLQLLSLGDGAALAETEKITDDEAHDLLAELDAAPVTVRLRTRRDAAGFTVIRADGQVWRNDPRTEAISPLRPLLGVEGLTLTGRDGSA